MPTGVTRKRTRSGTFKAASLARRAMKYMGGPNPPKRDISFPQGRQTLRYSFAAALNGTSVLRSDLMSILVSGISANANTPVRHIHSIQVLAVELWSPPSSSADNKLAINWRGSTTMDRVLDDSNVSNTASYIKSRPPKTSDCSDIILEGVSESTAAFDVWGPAGTILDLHFTCTVFSSATDAHSTASTSSSATNLVFYFNSLAGNIEPLTPLNVIT